MGPAPLCIADLRIVSSPLNDECKQTLEVLPKIHIITNQADENTTPINREDLRSENK